MKPSKPQPSEDLLKKARFAWRVLKKRHPNARIALEYSDPFQLLVATILSAQCTDKRVNIVTKDLFKKYHGPRDFVRVPPEELEQDIRSTGFFRNKTKSIQGAAKALLEKHGGEVPSTLEELTTLPGVGRKTANVVLGQAFGVPGITVDTHVARIARRLGLTKNRDARKIEFDLMDLIPKKDWTLFSNAVIRHGRQVCDARKPMCDICPLQKHCDEYSKI